MNKVFEDIYKSVWDEIFPGIVKPEIQVFKKLFAQDILLPDRYTAQKGTGDIYCTPDYGYKHFISQEEIQKIVDVNNYVEPTTPLSSLSEVLTKMQNLAFFRGSKSINSDVVEESDNIYSSNYVLSSACLYSSQKMIYCYNMTASEYMLASKNSKESGFGIRIIDSGSITGSFDVSFSAKSAHSYFCHNCFDVRDCMFCFHLASKQYCIANMQYSQEDYEKLKKQILTEYFAQLNSEKPFISLRDL